MLWSFLFGLYNCSRIGSCSPELDVDYRGIPVDNDLIYEYAPNFQACCALCDTISACKAWSWVFETKVCVLKTSVGYKIATSGSKCVVCVDIGLFKILINLFFWKIKRNFGSKIEAASAAK